MARSEADLDCKIFTLSSGLGRASSGFREAEALPLSKLRRMEYPRGEQPYQKGQNRGRQTSTHLKPEKCRAELKCCRLRLGFFELAFGDVFLLVNVHESAFLVAHDCVRQSILIDITDGQLRADT